MIYGVSLVYPDMPAYPKEYEGGLLKELGGAGATKVSTSGLAPRGCAIDYHDGMVANNWDRREHQVTASWRRVRWSKQGLCTRLIDEPMQRLDHHGSIRRIAFCFVTIGDRCALSDQSYGGTAARSRVRAPRQRLEGIARQVQRTYSCKDDHAHDNRRKVSLKDPNLCQVLHSQFLMPYAVQAFQGEDLP